MLARKKLCKFHENKEVLIFTKKIVQIKNTYAIAHVNHTPLTDSAHLYCTYIRGTRNVG